MSIPTPLSRRHLLGAAGAMGAAALASGCSSSGKPCEAGAPAFCPEAARKGRLKQSVTDWPYVKHFGGLDGLCKTAKDLGCVSVELCGPKDWPTLQKHGLVCAITGSHGFVKGFNDPANHDMCVATIKEAVDASASTGCCPSVITFTGFREGIPDDVGAKNTVAGLKKVIGYCEGKKINLVIEMLNSRVAEDMKGHPGYQGDHMDYVIDIIKQVGSPRMKVLFDFYHVQVMDGDVMTRLKKHFEYVGHIHTAGVPGRCEIGPNQELNYRPIFQLLADLKYAGYVGHEFVPTRDALDGLKEAVALATV
jgi:hydroxypyruvate isomerase